MFTTIIRYKIEPSGPHCGHCDYCIYNDGGDYYPYYTCTIFDGELKSVGNKYSPHDAVRNQECLDAEKKAQFEEIIEKQLENKD